RLPVDRDHTTDLRERGELVGDRGARTVGELTEQMLRAQVVRAHDETVDLVIELRSLLRRVLLVDRERALESCDGERRHDEAQLFEAPVLLLLGRELRVAALEVVEHDREVLTSRSVEALRRTRSLVPRRGIVAGEAFLHVGELQDDLATDGDGERLRKPRW